MLEELNKPKKIIQKYMHNSIHVWNVYIYIFIFIYKDIYMYTSKDYRYSLFRDSRKILKFAISALLIYLS